MKKVKFNKEMKERYNQYKASTARNLYDAYTTFSKAKHDAFAHCAEIQFALNGSNGRILTASKFVFTYGFVYFTNDGKEKRFVLITPSKELDAIVEGV